MFESDVVEIPLTNGLTAIVDAVDADLLRWNWQPKPDRDKRCYAKRKGLKGQDSLKTIQMHRIILSRMLGRDLSKGELVDHIDGNGLNNRRSNLRSATNQQNQQNANRHIDNTSGYKNVRFYKGKWMARVSANNQRIYLGMFDTPELAYAAVKTASIQYQGEFARVS